MSVVLVYANAEGTHLLDICLVICVSANGYNLKHWRATNRLDPCSVILFSVPDLLRH